MAESIADLNIQIRASADKIAADFNRDMSAQQGAIQARAVALGTVIGNGITAGLSKAMQGIKSAISMGFEGMDRIDALDEAASKIGMTYNALQDLKFAAETTGGSFEGMVSALAKMQANISSGSAAEAMQRLGLSIEQIKQLAPEQQFAEISQKLSEIKNTGDKIDLTKQIFGKGGTDILNVINSGKAGLSEMSQTVQSLGGHLTDVQKTMTTMAYGDIEALKEGWGYVKDQIAVGISPAISMITQQIMVFAQQAGGIAPLVQGWVQGAVNFAASLATVAQFIDVIISGIKSVGSVIGAAVATLTTGIDAGHQRFKVMMQELSIGFRAVAVGVADDFINAFNRVSAVIQTMINTAKREFAILQLEATKMISGGANAGLDASIAANQSNIANFVPAQLPTGFEPGGPGAELFPDGVPVVDYTKAETAQQDFVQASQEGLNAIGDAANETGDKLKAIYDGNLWGDNMRKGYADAQAAMEADARNQIATAQETAGKLAEIDQAAATQKTAVAKASAAERVVVEDDAMKHIAEANKRTADQFRNTNQSAVTDMVTAWATGTGSISSIINQWASNMIRQFAQVALFGNKAGGGSVAGLIGSTAGGSSGGGWAGMVGSLLGGFFAEGGRPPMGKVSVVGENGPELFVPDSAGKIVPSKRAATFAGAGGGGGAQTVESPIIINQSFANGVTRAELAGSMDDMMEQTTSAVAAAVSRGGGYRKRVQS